MKTPCVNCERKGCGTYHDECPAYQEFKAYKNAEIEKRIEVSKSFGAYIPTRLYKNRGGNTQFKCHKKR